MVANEMRLKCHHYKEIVKALSKIGFKPVRQKGSHLVLKGLYKDKKRTVVVPKHEEIAIGTLKGILFQAGLTAEEFLELIKKI